MIGQEGASMLLAALVTAVLGGLALRFAGKRGAAIAIVRALIPLIYFTSYYDASWTIIDDITYARQGRLLLDAGWNPFSVLADPRGLLMLVGLSDGYHFLYGWFNLAAQWIYGPYYWAPVFWNVVLTCIAAAQLRRLVRDCGASVQYANAIGIFFSVHWEVLVWSSFMNVKDLLVMVLTLGLLRGLVLVAQDRRRAGWGMAGGFGFLLLWIRFYVPLVASVAMGAYWMTQRRRGFRWRGLLATGILGALALYAVRGRLAGLAAVVQVSPGDLAFGWLRTLLSPLPWQLQREYGFLLVPAVLQFLTLPFAAYGAYQLVKPRGPTRIPFLYVAVLLLSVAAQPALQGPRHRIQILFVLAWAQFHGLYLAAAEFVDRRRVPRAAHG